MKTIIVTGANSGLGLWTTKYLLDLDYTVIMACRDINKAQKVIDEFPESYKRENIIVKELDLADFDSIKKFVDGLYDFTAIYGLDCNAGLTYKGNFRYTSNGIEETFGVNHIGHFLLANLLLEKFVLERIVIVSSGLHDPRNKSPFAKAVFKPVNEMAYPEVNSSIPISRQTQEFYATSKLCNILFAYELDRRLKQKQLPIKTMVNAINPGFIPATNFSRTHKPMEKVSRIFMGAFFGLIGLSDSPQNAAKNIVELFGDVNSDGQYYEKGNRSQSSNDSYDVSKAKTLWEGTEKIVGLKFLN